MGAAILDRKSWGPPSWIGSDVIGAKVAPILLSFLPHKKCINLDILANPSSAFIEVHVQQHNLNFRGARFFSGTVLDLRSIGSAFEPQPRHCVDTLSSA